jgi:hypothetical protein
VYPILLTGDVLPKISRQTTFPIFRYDHLDQFCVTRICLVSALLVSLEEQQYKEQFFAAMVQVD